MARLSGSSSTQKFDLLIHGLPLRCRPAFTNVSAFRRYLLDARSSRERVKGNCKS